MIKLLDDPKIIEKLCIAELFHWLKRYIFNLAYCHYSRFFKNFRLFKE